MTLSYKLTYFDGKGRGELLRLAFACAGQEFEDHRIQFADWPSIKETTPFGSLPVLEITAEDGTVQKLAQSLSIARFLGREFGLTGNTAFEQAQVDAGLEQINELFVAFIPVMFEKDPLVKQRKEAKFFAENVPKHLATFEKRLAQSGRQFLVADCLTVADLYFMVVADTLKEKSCMNESVVLARYRNVACYLNRIRSLPAVLHHNNKV